MLGQILFYSCPSGRHTTGGENGIHTGHRSHAFVVIELYFESEFSGGQVKEETKLVYIPYIEQGWAHCFINRIQTRES